jgi:hypothetical protein
VEAEKVNRYYLYVVANMRDWENIHYQYRHGTFDQHEFDAEKVAWKHVIDKDKSFLRSWCRLRQNYSQAFVAELESLLQENACAETR